MTSVTVNKSIFVTEKLDIISDITDINVIHRVGQKRKPDNFCQNGVHCQPIFIIFGTHRPTLEEIGTL